MKVKVLIVSSKAECILLKKCLASWKIYVRNRQRKKEFYFQGQENGKLVVKR